MTPVPAYYRTTYHLAADPTAVEDLALLVDDGAVVYLGDASTVQSVGWCFAHGKPLHDGDRCTYAPAGDSCEPGIAVVMRKYPDR